MWRVADTNDSRRPELSGASIAWGGNASDRAAEFMRGGVMRMLVRLHCALSFSHVFDVFSFDDRPSSETSLKERGKINHVRSRFLPGPRQEVSCFVSYCFIVFQVMQALTVSFYWVALQCRQG